LSGLASEHTLAAYTLGTGPTEGYRLNIAVAEGPDALALYRHEGNFRFLISPKSPIELETGRGRRILAAPCLVWNWEGLVPPLQADATALKLISFHPDVVNGRFTYELLRCQEGLSVTESQDLYFMEPFLQAAGDKAGCLELAFAEAPHFLKLFDNLKLLLERHDFEGWPCESRATVIELMFALRRLTDRILPDTLTETQDELVGRVAFAVQARLSEALHVVDLSREFATNRTSLTERFQAAYGCGVIEFQRAARLRAAQAMLKDTFLPIDSIMQRVGYNDASAFSRAFKGNYGCPPSEYRNQHSWMLGRN